jgi:hypothetical protein
LIRKPKYLIRVLFTAEQAVPCSNTYITAHKEIMKSLISDHFQVKALFIWHVLSTEESHLVILLKELTKRTPLYKKN